VQPQIRAAAMPRSSPSPEFMKDPIVLEPSGAGISDLRQRFERPLLAIFAVVALVLLIACANVANLQLARGAARRRELSVRLALGASRWRLARQLLIESAVLAAMGAALGLVFAVWASRALIAQISTSTTRVVLDLSLDWRVLAFTGATLAAAVVIFGIAPAFRAASIAPIDALKEHGPASARASGRGDALGGRWNLGSTLVVGQVAVSLALVVAAGLFIRTFERLAGASLGFDAGRVLMVTLSTPSVPAAARNVLYHRLVSAAAASPGVARAGGSINPPLVGTLNGDLVVTRPGEPVRADADTVSQSNFITPGWLAAYGTAIRDGRDIDERDTMATPQVMLVNEAFVRWFAAAGTVVGTAFALTARIPPSGDFPLGSKTVVGVVGDAVYRSIREPARPTLYFPLAQRDDPLLFSDFFIAVRPASGSPHLLMRSVAAALTEVNRDVTLSFRPVADQVTASIAQDRLVAMLSGFFGALALLLAGLGLYGVTAYAVALRRAEIGIRMALGAAPAGVVRMVLSRVSRVVGAGVLVGAAISLAASTLIGSLLYGIEARDPLTLAGAALTLAVVGGLAAWLPAYRASRVDPAEVLREG
jgi:putative ABC transport system permease protein